MQSSYCACDDCARLRAIRSLAHSSCKGDRPKRDRPKRDRRKWDRRKWDRRKRDRRKWDRRKRDPTSPDGRTRISVLHCTAVP